MKLNTIRVQKSQQTNIYEPLPDGAYTRVLILEPGRRRQPLRCQLKVVNLEENPDFEAISYVWGRGIKRKKVVCNGARVKITANLLQALVAVRDPSRPRTVWADSISINQDDDKEKGRQVAMMGLVYNRARRVLIHLAGDDGGHAHGVATFVSEKLAMILHQIDSLAEKLAWLGGQNPGDAPAEVPYLSAEETQLMSEDPKLQSVKHLLDHPWFKRGWVIQEVVLAQNAVVIWSSHIISRFDRFMVFYSWLVRTVRGAYAKYSPKSLGVLPALYQYRFRYAMRPLGFDLETQPSLLIILDQARRLELKDPRDRIYAFLYLEGLDDRLDVAVDATSRLAIQPDYSKSVAEVYTDFARHCVKSGDVKVLHYVNHTQNSLVQKVFASWVPRWDVHQSPSLIAKPGVHPSIYPSHPTSDNRSKEIARLDGNCLIVQGVVFDRVRACHGYSPSGSHFITLDNVASFWPTVRTSMAAYPPEHIGLALLDTLTTQSAAGSWPEWLQEKEVFIQFLREIGEDSDNARGFATRIPLVEQCISIASWGRKLVSTERGYLALAPRITEENDLCCIIFGCCFPFILREVECASGSEQQSYRVVGDAWVVGKHAVELEGHDGELSMPRFGGKDSMQWETWGLKQGDIRLV